MPGPATTPYLKSRDATATFAATVSKGTGLTLATVLAWIRAEGGSSNNPLNIIDQSTKKPYDYGSPQAAAQAVIANLHTPLYAPVIATAKQTPNNSKAQLQAIAQSPWDFGHYTGGQHGPTPGVPWGTTLLGALASNGSNPYTQTNRTVASEQQLGIPNPLTWASGWLGDLQKWVTGEASTALAYIVLTFLGIALVVLGLLEVFGLGPRGAAALVATKGASAVAPKAGEPGSSQLAQGDSIPF